MRISLLLVLFSTAVLSVGHFMRSAHQRSLQRVPDAEAEQSRILALAATCSSMFRPSDAGCPRYVIARLSPGGGFGHQFTEMLFGMNFAVANRASYVFQPFIDSETHSGDYALLNDIMGLPALFKFLGGVSATDVFADRRVRVVEYSPGVHSHANSGCGVALHVSGYNYCSNDRGHSDAGNCWHSDDSAYLYTRAADCFRMAASVFGTALKSCIMKSYTAEAGGEGAQKIVYVVWHIRYGDAVMSPANGTLIRNVVDALRFITEDYRTEIFLVGGGVPKSAKPQSLDDYYHAITTLTRVAWGGSSATSSVFVRKPEFLIDAALKAMMQADILIGSGSSFPLIAFLTSGMPLFLAPTSLNPTGVTMVSDMAEINADGYPFNSRYNLRSKLIAVLDRPTRPCRENYSTD